MRFIGCKKNLLSNIEALINDKCIDAHIFCDIFAGTGTVGNYFKDKYEIISNDILYFSFVLQKGLIELNYVPTFDKLIEYKNKYEKTKIKNIYDYLNNLDPEKYNDKKCITERYSILGNRMYLTERNALKIDYMRAVIEKWYQENLITQNEYFYLIACIIQEVPSVSNIAGTYGAFLKKWDKRAFKEFEISPLNVKINKYNNKVFNQDGIELLKNISGDILYVDPPYNSRQYLPNYHLLETVAKYDFPEVIGVTGIRKYSKEKSNWCLKAKVYEEFEKLMQNAKFKYIIFSYNSEGLMRKGEIEKIMKKYGKESTFTVIEIPYRRFKSNNNNTKNNILEYLFFIEM